MVLYVYGRTLHSLGPRRTLFLTTCVCAAAILVTILALLWTQGSALQVVVMSFYVFREIYVMLLSTQQWAFIGSVLDVSFSSWLPPLSGFGSVASAIAGYAVGPLALTYGVHGLLTVALCMVLVSCALGQLAYSITGAVHVSDHKVSRRARPSSPGSASDGTQSSLWRETRETFARNPILTALFLETLAHQCVSSLLSLSFHEAVRQKLGTDSESDGARAQCVGRFYALVNASAALLQFCVLPRILSPRTLGALLAAMPGLVGAACALRLFRPSLDSAMFAFGIMKVTEYALHAAAHELLYMPLDYDARYMGKEVIGFFAHRLGKSGASLALGLITFHTQSVYTLSALTTGAVFAWGLTTIKLTAHIPEASIYAHLHIRAKGNTQDPALDEKLLPDDNVGTSRSREQTKLLEEHTSNTACHNAGVPTNEMSMTAFPSDTPKRTDGCDQCGAPAAPWVQRRKLSHNTSSTVSDTSTDESEDSVSQQGLSREISESRFQCLHRQQTYELLVWPCGREEGQQHQVSEHIDSAQIAAEDDS